MQIANEKVVSIHYTLTNDQGDTIDSSQGQTPLVYLHGSGQIIPGLEDALLGKKTGDKLKVSIAPEQAYGERHDHLVQQVPKEQFPDTDLQVGMQFQVETNQQPIIVTITHISDAEVTVDGNHPLAGQTLHFDVEVVELREATEQELAHGHAHGAGGHDH